MTVLLINPPFSNYGGIKGHGGKVPPLNLGYLAAVLRDEGHKVSLLDAEAMNLTYQDIEKHLKQKIPFVVGITAPTPAFPIAIKIAEITKKVNPNTKVVVGGPHPSALPINTVELKEIDFAIIGEGEYTLLELVGTLEKGKESYENIDGLVYKKSGDRVIANRPRKPIENLDELPFPARDLMPNDCYRLPPSKRNTNRKPTSMLTSRGCPFNCIYCISHVIWGRRCRVRSPENVVDEIESVINDFDMREINFHDDAFTLFKDRAMKICKLIVTRKLDVSWTCMSRVDTISRDIVNEMKKAGCDRISFGVESGSQRVLNILKKGTTVDQARRAVNICKEEGVKVHCAFMIGNPSETREEVMETINFAKSLDPDVAAFFITMPYPGTELYRIALERKYIEEDVNWMEFAPISSEMPIMHLEELDPRELKDLHKKAYKQFYLRPKFIIKKLQEIRTFGDVRILVDGAALYLRVTSSRFES